MTALTYMAAVADARVPCPLCGGLIHPVAGRCKHCKQDLSAHRGARPQAQTALPSLANAAVVVAVPEQSSQPILPPRPTGRSVPVVAEPRKLWRSWPVYVIILAGIAIVGAVAVMMWPASHAIEKHTLTPPPAPERMDTNPTPPPSTDPWGQPHAQLAPVPSPKLGVPRPTPSPVPDLKDPFSDDDLQDPFNSMHGGTGGLQLGGPNAAGLAVNLGKHLCTVIARCPNAQGSMMTSLCSAYTQLPQMPSPTCPAAQRCLQKVDAMSCTDAVDSSSPWEVMQQVQDCIDAMRC